MIIHVKVLCVMAILVAIACLFPIAFAIILGVLAFISIYAGIYELFNSK